MTDMPLSCRLRNTLQQEKNQKKKNPNKKKKNQNKNEQKRKKNKNTKNKKQNERKTKQNKTNKIKNKNKRPPPQKKNKEQMQIPEKCYCFLDLWTGFDKNNILVLPQSSYSALWTCNRSRRTKSSVS